MDNDWAGSRSEWLYARALDTRHVGQQIISPRIYEQAPIGDEPDIALPALSSAEDRAS
jgi:hypothetical protein